MGLKSWVSRWLNSQQTIKAVVEPRRRARRSDGIKLPPPLLPRGGARLPQPIDPVEVGNRARAHRDSERAAGREVSATEAVAHILGKR